MKIIWRDTDLKKHEIELTNAVDVKIDGIAFSLNGGNGIRIHTDDPISVFPVASNAIVVK